MTTRFFSSANTNHVLMSGEVGKVIAVLDSVLINGINLPTITTIERSGSTATITFNAAHGLLKTAKITVSGCTQTEYNGTFSATVTNTTQVTYTVSGTPASPATGTPAARLDGAGWTKEFTGTNKAVYKQGAGSNGRYLRIDDTNANDARIVAYETCGDIDAVTSSGPMPTSAQITGGGYLKKSATADTTERSWNMVADEKFFALFINQSGTATASSCLIFGDFPSQKTGDTFNTYIACGNSATVNSGGYPFYTLQAYNATATALGRYFFRSASGTGGSTMCNTLGIMSHAYIMTTIGNSTAMASPDTATGKYYQSKIGISESNGIRGILPAIWCPCHQRPFTHLDTFDGTGDLAGRSFIVLDLIASGQCFLEISDTWYN